MNLAKFRTYQQAVQFYRLAGEVRCPSHLKDQLHRAASSIVLNLAEGSGKGTSADQRRFFQIALGSLRECQAVLDLCLQPYPELASICDQLGAQIYRLCHPVR